MSTNYTVREGDCMDSIACSHGFFPDTIWAHPDNSELKRLRKDANILQPGDVVVIPDLEEGEETGATEEKHRFRRKGVPAKLRLVFYRPVPPEEQEDDADSDSDESSGGAQQDDGSVFEEAAEEAGEFPMEPIADQDCTIEIDGLFSEARSDGDGLVEISIPPNAQSASVKFFAGTVEELCFPLNLGEMDSIETVVGARKRLHNLGYRCPADGDEMDAILGDAVLRFQRENDLEATGEIDQATRDKLVEVHGS